MQNPFRVAHSLIERIPIHTLFIEGDRIEQRYRCTVAFELDEPVLVAVPVPLALSASVASGVFTAAYCSQMSSKPAKVSVTSGTLPSARSATPVPCSPNPTQVPPDARFAFNRQI